MMMISESSNDLYNSHIQGRHDDIELQHHNWSSEQVLGLPHGHEFFSYPCVLLKSYVSDVPYLKYFTYKFNNSFNLKKGETLSKDECSPSAIFNLLIISGLHNPSSCTMCTGRERVI